MWLENIDLLWGWFSRPMNPPATFYQSRLADSCDENVISRDTPFPLFVLAVNLQLSTWTSRPFWSSHLLPFIPLNDLPAGNCRTLMHWALHLADDFLHHILTHSYPEGNFLPFHCAIRNFPSQNSQSAERNPSISFRTPSRASSI